MICELILKLLIHINKLPLSKTRCVIRKKRFAMLDTLICAEKDGLIDDIGISEEVDTLMAEGYDTTSIGLVFGLMNMSLYAAEQELCYQEIQEHILGKSVRCNRNRENHKFYSSYRSRRPEQPEPKSTK